MKCLINSSFRIDTHRTVVHYSRWTVFSHCFEQSKWKLLETIRYWRYFLYPNSNKHVQFAVTLNFQFSHDEDSRLSWGLFMINIIHYISCDNAINGCNYYIHQLLSFIDIHCLYYIHCKLDCYPEMIDALLLCFRVIIDPPHN